MLLFHWQVLEDGDDFFFIAQRRLYNPPSFLGLKNPVIGSVIIASDPMGDILFAKNRIDQLGFNLVFQNQDFSKLFHFPSTRKRLVDVPSPPTSSRFLFSAEKLLDFQGQSPFVDKQAIDHDPVGKRAVILHMSS
jgi:hypothetical protein